MEAVRLAFALGSVEAHRAFDISHSIGERARETPDGHTQVWLSLPSRSDGP